MTYKTFLLVSVAAAIVVINFGCGDSSGLPRRYAVSGTVTYNGKSLDRGNINFVPDGPEGRAAGGTIVNGQYSLTDSRPE